MRKLHVVGFTTDLDGLIFSTRKGSASGGFVVPISDELYDKLAEAERLRNGGEPSGSEPGADAARRGEGEGRTGRPESALTPREIQARLRTGRTIDEVAREAGVTADWVERFARPILAEQAQIVEVARAMTFSKPRLGPSAEPLGRSVARNLVDRGVRLLDEEFDGGWSAYQIHDGVWMVRFQYHSRARLLMAAWEIDVGAGLLTARDRHASDLGYIEPGRHRSAAVPGDDDEGAAPRADAESMTDGEEVTAPAARRPAGRRGASRPGRPRVPISALPRTAVESAAKRPVPPSKAGAKATSAGKPGKAAKAGGADPAGAEAAGARAAGATTAGAAGAKGARAGAARAKGARAGAAGAAGAGAGSVAKARKVGTAGTANAVGKGGRVGTAGTGGTGGTAMLTAGRTAKGPAAGAAGRPAPASKRGPSAPPATSSAARRSRVGTVGAEPTGRGEATARAEATNPPAAPSRPDRPKFGTDGTQLAKATNRPRPRPAAAPPVPRTPSPPPAATPPGRSLSRGLIGLTRSNPPAGGQNGSSAPPRRPLPAPAPVPPPQVPRPYEPRRAAPRPAPAPAPPPVSSRPPDRGRFDPTPSRARPLASVDDMDLGVELDLSEVMPPRPRPTPEPAIRGGILGRRRAAPPEEPPRDEDDRDRPGGQDAFVIRPRISAKQASEFAFNDDRPR